MDDFENERRNRESDRRSLSSYSPEAAMDGWAGMLAWFRAHGIV